jgi:hypothetical protein
MKLSRINLVWLLEIYVFLNLYKPILGIVLAREILTALSIFISICLFGLYLTGDLLLARIQKKKFFSLLLLTLFGMHLLYSIIVLRAADVYPSLVSFFQIITPMLFLFVLDSLDKRNLDQLVRFVLKCLVPFIVFGFIEFLLPLDIRKQLYMGFSQIVTGEKKIDVAYYLGDTDYGGLRLGSLFFEPLTFAFVTTFLTIYLFSKKSKAWWGSFLTNILSLGKLPIATTIISMSSYLFKRMYLLYYLLIIAVISSVLVYFVSHAEEIAVENPSLGSHMLGLAYGLINAQEAPLIGHGFGTAGYVSLVYYKKINEEGPFKRDLTGLMNGNESAVGSIAYQTGYLLLFLFLFFFIRYFLRLVKKRQIMMASGVVGYIMSLFLSESVLSITVVSVLLILSQGLIHNNENKFAVNY